jgi:transposase
MKNWDNTLRQLEQLDDIPGIDKTATAAILAEIGTDMSRFKTAEHICSWAGLSPGNNESAGKKVHPHHPR